MVDPLVNVPHTTMASAMMFGSILFAAVGMSTRMWYVRGEDAFWSCVNNPRAKALNIQSYESVLSGLYHFSVFGLILFVAYLCEHHPPFPHSEKSYDRDEFFFLTAMLFLASFYTITKNEKTPAVVKKPEDNSKKEAAEVSAANDVLNRNQTEEWKGWMQYMFLFYHYYHAEEVYNSIRIMITCYVWMTGFGNFSFFYLKADYSFVRVIQMLWRLNFLVIFLCLTQGTTYILYYICPLHTFFFGMVYATMRVAKHLNYTATGIRIKLFIVAIIIYFIWDVNDGIFAKLHFFLSTNSVLGAKGGTLWEWYFRSTLDHWSTFLGMLFALNYPITSLFIRKLEAQSSLCRQWTAKLLVGLPLLSAFAWWVLTVFTQPKLEYNQTNAYFGFIPLVTYIYLRNLSPTLRSYSLNLLHEIGKTTLETYLMQHHIWLTSNAKSLLTIIPGWPKLNMLVVSFFYFYASRRLYKLTLYLRGMLLPDDARTCITSIMALFGTIAFFYILTILLDTALEMNLIIIGIVSIACGSILYRGLVHLTTTTSEETAPSTTTTHHHKKNYPKQSPTFWATMAVLLVGGVWKCSSAYGAGKIQQKLQAHCDVYVNDGMWVPIQDCNEESRGSIHRLHDIDSVATCDSQNMVWGWKETPPYSHCRFRQRSSKELKSTLQGRTILFVGDILNQNLYNSLIRNLGTPEESKQDTNEPIPMQKIGDISLGHLWSRNAQEHLDIIRNLINMSNEGLKVDLLVMGGAFAFEESVLRELAKEIQIWNRENSPVVWVTPIYHDWEEEVENLKVKTGVLAASAFVLNGKSIAQTVDNDGVYDAGIQILANAMDWLLPETTNRSSSKPASSPPIGSMSHPNLGLLMLLVVAAGLFLYDGYFGCSYMASLVIPGVKPSQLYDEAFSKLHASIQKHVPEATVEMKKESKEEEIASLVMDDTEKGTSV